MPKTFDAISVEKKRLVLRLGERMEKKSFM